ncbi:hypothetical protein [Paractinoplanes deccanensis]|nr:hypothetical protein [Actinoplanes deccanensis]
MPAEVLFDPAAAYPETGVVRAAMAARDWGRVRATVDGLPAAGRTMMLRIAGEVGNTEDMLRYLVGNDPSDSTAAATLAWRYIDAGWKIRTGAQAQDVSPEQFAAFHDWLRRAEAILIDAVARTPGDPALWTARLTSARGLEVGQAETRRRYDKLVALEPHHLPAQSQFLQTLCPKWSGSWAELHPWARGAALAAPEGAVQGVLVADAHIEHWSTLPAGDDDRYLRSEPVRAELYEAANRSVLHPDFGRDHGWVHAASSFALVFSLLGDRRAAATAFRVLGDLADEYPWYYLPGDTASQVRTRRAEALGRSAR